MIPSTDRTVLYFSFRFFFSVNDMILTQPEPQKEWLRQQHHMGEAQTDFHPCDAVLSTGIQVKPLPFCFSTFLPFSLFWIKFIHRPREFIQIVSQVQQSPSQKSSWVLKFLLFGFGFCFFCLAPKNKRKEIRLWFLLETSTVLSCTECKLDRSSGNLHQCYVFLSIRSCLWAENVQNKNREWFKEHLHKSCHC